MLDRVFYSACFGFILGILLRSFIFVNLQQVFLLGLVTFALILFFSFISFNKWGIAVSVFLVLFSLGILRFHVADKPLPQIFESHVGDKVSLSGIIVDEPDVKETNKKITVQTNLEGEEIRILVTINQNNDLKYGDLINFSGKLEKPENFMTDQGKTFDYVNYLRKDGVLYVMDYPKVELVSRGNGNKIKSALFAAKDSFLKKINSAIPKPESTLMGGLILGEKSAFSADLRQSFINTGTIHIVALSGYNVTIVAEWIMKLFGFLPQNFGTGAGVFSILLFILMTGGSSTAIRAGIMASLALVARTIGRDYDVVRALLLAGIVMLSLNPFILVYDVSFQLSFIATLAVILLAPRIEKYFAWIKWKWLRDIVSITAAAYIFVLPFILYKMGNLSLVALPVNVLILPFIPATMLSGFLAGLTGFISPIIALPFVYLSYGLLHYELFAIGFFSSLPMAAVVIKNFPLVITILIYLFFAYFLYKRRNSEKDDVVRSETSNPFSLKNLHSPVFAGIVLIAIIFSGFLFYSNNTHSLEKESRLRTLLSASAVASLRLPDRSKEENCRANGSLPDALCSPGAVFAEATPEIICVRGYTRTVRDVSTKLRKKVYAAYGVPYPQPRGAYEVDHLIPLELGGSNDIANLFLESADPRPGFKEKDLVENFLNHEVCAGRADLAAAQYQIATDWLAVYANLSPEQISFLKSEYASWAGN